MRLRMFLLALLLTASLYAQDISGKWQGMLHRGQQDVRVILKIDKAAWRFDRQVLSAWSVAGLGPVHPHRFSHTQRHRPEIYRPLLSQWHL